MIASHSMQNFVIYFIFISFNLKEFCVLIVSYMWTLKVPCIHVPRWGISHTLWPAILYSCLYILDCPQFLKFVVVPVLSLRYFIYYSITVITPKSYSLMSCSVNKNNKFLVPLLELLSFYLPSIFSFFDFPSIVDSWFHKTFNTDIQIKKNPKIELNLFFAAIIVLCTYKILHRLNRWFYNGLHFFFQILFKINVVIRE